MSNLGVADPTAGHDFYEGFLGLRKEFDLGWIAGWFFVRDPHGIVVDVVAHADQLHRHPGWRSRRPRHGREPAGRRAARSGH